MADIKSIKRIKIGDTAYNIRDDSVDSQINIAIGKLNSSATVASESNGTITITKTVAETDGKIGNGSGSTNTYTAATIDNKDAATLADAKKYTDDGVTKLVGGMVFKGSVGDSGTVT